MAVNRVGRLKHQTESSAALTPSYGKRMNSSFCIFHADFELTGGPIVEARTLKA